MTFSIRNDSFLKATERQYFVYYFRSMCVRLGHPVVPENPRPPACSCFYLGVPLICIEMYEAAATGPTEAPLLFTRRNNFTERPRARYFLLTPRGKAARVASYEISRARLSSRSVYSHVWWREVRGEMQELSRARFIRALTARPSKCIAICTPYDCIRAIVRVCTLSGDYVGYAAFPASSCNDERLRRGGDGERNPLRRDTYAPRTACRTAHTHTRARTHTFTFLFPWRRRVGARYPTPRRE